MPKHGFLTPKAIANRIKAKGLQKLRWYCQMCQKQCRDENGFKCHTMSESHQRQLLLFAESPDKYIDQFSQDFLDEFMELLRRRFGTRRVHANQVYQEYIADRDHLHMNATQWETLTDFVKWLGKVGHCVVDETEKGWFIAYIDRDPETIRRQEAAAKQEKMKLDDEERMAKLFQLQMERDRERSKSKPKPESVYTELKREQEEEKVTFALKTAAKPIKTAAKQNPLLASTSGSDGKKKKKDDSAMKQKRKLALEEIIETEIAMKEKKVRRENWLIPNIVVKMMLTKYGNSFYKKKGVVKKVIDDSTAEVYYFDVNKSVIVDKKDVETVIPNVGRRVLFVNGNHKGEEAELIDINFEKFCCKVQLKDKTHKDKIIDYVKYEDISKLHVS